MMRFLYRVLVGLHPPRFRRRFGPEMLCAFDDSGGGSSLPLFTDAIASIARQWIIRESLWIYAAAVAGGLLTLYTGFNAGRPAAAQARFMHDDPRKVFFFIAAVGSFQAIALVTIFCVALFRFTKRRLHA